MAVLPETMDPLGTDAGDNFRILEDYIHYLSQRLEFSMANLGRGVNGAGVSTAAVALELRGLQNTVSTLQSTLGQLTGEVNALKTSAAGLAGRAAALETAAAALETAAGALEGRVAALETAAGALEDRVAALEA